LVLVTAALAGCSGGKAGGAGVASNGSGSNGGGAGQGGTAALGAGCPDLFDQAMVRTYSIDISPDQWNAIMAEFHDMGQLLQSGNDFATRHPVTLHLDKETVSDASLRLHGQSSWAQAVMLDGDKAKMQFDISFHQSDPSGTFHGVGKLVFDMPRSDWTFLHDRLAHAWFRSAGIAAGCVASARVEINGSYYGLYAVEENTGKRVLAQFYPGATPGGLWKAANWPETGQTPMFDSRRQAFLNASDFASVSAIVDLDASVSEWAGEALMNSGDNYYGGDHNFYIYDTGPKGLVFLPNDTDSTFDWLILNDMVGAKDHPVYFWEGRAQPAPHRGHIWRIAMSDAATRRKYADAIDAQLKNWDVQKIQGWIDTWSQQIASAVAADPHTPVTMGNFQQAVAAARSVVADRAAYLKTFVDCENGNGADADGDGVKWCDDCRDDNPSVHPGATEVCGNGLDDDCNGVVDDCH
jgi:hypothetical protein